MELTLTREEAEAVLLNWANTTTDWTLLKVSDGLFNKAKLGEGYSHVGVQFSYEPPEPSTAQSVEEMAP